MSIIKGEAPVDLCSPDEFDKKIPDSRSLQTDNQPEKHFAEDPPPKSEAKQIDRGHEKLDSKSPDLEITTDSDPDPNSDFDWYTDSDSLSESECDPEKPYNVKTKRGWKCFSTPAEMIKHVRNEQEDEKRLRKQTDQTVIGEVLAGGSQTSSEKPNKSRKRKRLAKAALHLPNMDNCDKQTGDGDRQIADPKLAELEITTDAVSAQSLDSHKHINGGNERTGGSGESQISSRKRKQSHSPSETEEPSSSDEDEDDICTCPQPPLPEGYGYLPVMPCRDKNGEYSPAFTKFVRYMRCCRCGIDGDHFPHFCTNPVNDSPDDASYPSTWKYLLGDFDAKKYLEEERLKAEAKSDVPRECAHCQNLSSAESDEPPLPEGYGYLPVLPCRDKNGEYSPAFTKFVRYMRCCRCGIDGDHFPHFCTNPVNDPPDAASYPSTWKYLLGDFDAKKYLEDQRLGLTEKPKRSWFTQGKEKSKRSRVMGLGFS